MNLNELEQQGHDEGLDSFYISFGDLMVILCVFLVMLLSMSNIEVGSFEKVKSVMTGKTENTLVSLAEDLSEIINGIPGVPGASVQLDSDGVRVNLDTSVLFEQGEAVIDEQALESVDIILKDILQTEYQVDIEGHTDDVAYYRIVDGETITNWTLSGRRASSMALHLRRMGFKADRIRIVGYADTRPVVDPESKRGIALEEARARNRRVSLLIR
ncbi:Photosystem I P700 chlorophyll a apoprotein A2 [Thalassocella blandensis]|nr:Photosystem I P700 chlorophyll a apoprotein A2 [Thalassocella blandensis]